jgi:hypothetical protein
VQHIPLTAWYRRKVLAFTRKSAKFRRLIISVVYMRAFPAVLLISAFLIQSAMAQGVRDPANLTSTSILTTSTKKTQTTQAPLRPTATRNLAPGTLRPGMAAQGVWKDGKLVAVPR